MNSLVLVGKVKEPLVVKETVNGIQVGQLIIEVDKNYQKDEEKSTDVFSVTLWRNNVELASSYKKGDIVTIKAHLLANNYQKDDGDIFYRTELIVEKIARL